jgi:cell division septation protein DedD
MTRMADPERPRDDLEDDEQRFEDEGRRSIFSALWFRAILVVVVLGVVAAVAVPYVLELANQPPAKPTIAAKPDSSPAPIATPPPPAPAPPPTMERPPAAERPTTESAPPPAIVSPAPPPVERPATVRKPDASTGETSTPRVARAPAPGAASSARGGAYFVQVGAFKSQDTARRLATRLREMNYNVEESSMSGPTAARGSAASSAPAAASDRYDVYVTGGAPAEIDAKLATKGLKSEPAAGGVIVKPSLPLREAVALSKDLAVDGLKVQVRRASGAPARAPSNAGVASSGDSLYRVRVGPFDDRAAATSTLRELEQRGYTPFIARAGQ